MDNADQNEEHLDQAITRAMGGEAPVANPLGVEAPASIPIHDGNELPEDCRGQGNDLDGWTHSTKPTLAASADKLTRHAQYLEWRAGIMTGQAAVLRSIAATR
jgi:hypothetical protein